MTRTDTLFIVIFLSCKANTRV